MDNQARTVESLVPAGRESSVATGMVVDGEDGEAGTAVATADEAGVGTTVTTGVDGYSSSAAAVAVAVATAVLVLDLQADLVGDGTAGIVPLEYGGEAGDEVTAGYSSDGVVATGADVAVAAGELTAAELAGT